MIQGIPIPLELVNNVQEFIHPIGYFQVPNKSNLEHSIRANNK